MFSSAGESKKGMLTSMEVQRNTDRDFTSVAFYVNLIYLYVFFHTFVHMRRTRVMGNRRGQF